MGQHARAPKFQDNKNFVQDLALWNLFIWLLTEQEISISDLSGDLGKLQKNTKKKNGHVNKTRGSVPKAAADQN